MGNLKTEKLINRVELYLRVKNRPMTLSHISAKLGVMRTKMIDILIELCNSGKIIRTLKEGKFYFQSYL